MILLRFIEFLRHHSAHLFKLGIALLVLLVVLDALPFVVDKSSAHTPVERIPGFWGVFGLAGCCLLVFLAKGLGALGLQQKEEPKDE